MKKLLGSSLIAITAAFSFTGSASAADLQKADTAPVVQEAQSPWQIRIRALGVVPRNKASVNQIPDSSMHFSSTFIPELDITYYFTNNIAAELILGTTYSSIDGRKALHDAGAGKLGKTWILPPTLTAQYHFTQFGKFKPYIGAGVNYTFFYNEDADHNSQGIGLSDLHINNSWGAAAQVGFDYMIDQHWGFNLDVKKLYLQPKWHGKLNSATADALDMDQRISGRAKLDPWLVGAGVTYRF